MPSAGGWVIGLFSLIACVAGLWLSEYRVSSGVDDLPKEKTHDEDRVSPAPRRAERGRSDDHARLFNYRTSRPSRRAARRRLRIPDEGEAWKPRTREKRSCRNGQGTR